ncbi:hypothetical protein Sste5346_006063 [Sporothrix stenoceras]|uniref:Aminoglycoside phosphotransferase domain-containing protein n=1 Tax=Sporothrix stenoceras TaxID=5173 RepID=A0ABR3Z155_9PEZI
MSGASGKPSSSATYRALVRKKRIEKGLPVSPTPSELERDNIVEDNADILSNVFGRMITLHPGNIIKKSGRGVCLGEADAMKAAAAGGVPVPEVFGTETTPEGRFRISMSYIEGQTLSEVWLDLSDDERKGYCRQIRAILNTMRAIPPLGFIGACDGKEIRDARNYHTYKAPICADENAFNEYLLSAIHTKATPPGVRTAFAQRLQKQPAHRIILTHGDLAPRNIMVRGGKIVALIDWEDAGWYPEYWEYVKFFQRIRSNKEEGWATYADDIFENTYPDELVDYIAISRYQNP